MLLTDNLGRVDSKHLGVASVDWRAVRARVAACDGGSAHAVILAGKVA